MPIGKVQFSRDGFHEARIQSTFVDIHVTNFMHNGRKIKKKVIHAITALNPPLFTKLPTP